MRWLAVLALALVAPMCAACDRHGRENSEGIGESRAFYMGLGTLPRELNADAYREAFALAGSAGDIALIQKAPPWEDILPDGTVGEETTATTAAELNALEDEDLELFFAIDPTDATTGRDRIGGLPQSYQGRGFADEEIRRAFEVYAEYVAVNYRPRYLALGVEMNLYYQHQPDDFEAYTALFEDTYAIVKEASPNTLVTLTFQYEDLQARLPTTEPHYTDWQLLAIFEPLVDVTAISTYPSLAFGSVDDIPANYYTQLRAFTDHPIVVASAGFSSGADGIGEASEGEQQQALFVERLLRESADIPVATLIWFAGWDPVYAEGTALAVFRHIGLVREDGSEKPAWRAWSDAANRPRSGD